MSAATLDRLSRALRDHPADFDTASLSEARQHLRAQDRSIDLRVPDAHAFRGYREMKLAPLGAIGLSLGCIESGTGYELSFQSRDEMLVNIPLRGHGWVACGTEVLAMRCGQMLLVGPSSHVVKHWAGPGQVLSLHIPLASLDAAVGGAPADGPHPHPRPSMPPYLPPVTLIDHGRMETLLGFVELLVLAAEPHTHGPAAPAPLLSADAARHAERLLLALLIDGLGLKPPSHTEPAAPGAVPYYVRRVEAYIRAHASMALGIDDLAAAAGVSPRTLQYGFRKAHGTTPMLYLKRERFKQAREALQQAQGRACKVSEIAAAIGLPNVSQFSREYRAMFGESPSETAGAPRRLLA